MQQPFRLPFAAPATFRKGFNTTCRVTELIYYDLRVGDELQLLEAGQPLPGKATITSLTPKPDGIGSLDDTDIASNHQYRTQDDLWDILCELYPSINTYTPLFIIGFDYTL